MNRVFRPMLNPWLWALAVSSAPSLSIRPSERDKSLFEWNTSIALSYQHLIDAVGPSSILPCLSSSILLYKLRPAVQVIQFRTKAGNLRKPAFILFTYSTISFTYNTFYSSTKGISPLRSSLTVWFRYWVDRSPMVIPYGQWHLVGYPTQALLCQPVIYHIIPFWALRRV